MRKKIIIGVVCLLLLFSAASLGAQFGLGIRAGIGPDSPFYVFDKLGERIGWQWVENQKKLFELNPPEINSILKKVQNRFPNKSQRLKALSILRLGTPYQFGGLGEESGRDKDPLFRLDVTDCTAFVLTNTALLYSQNLQEAREMMKFLNYRSPEDISFKGRLHFTTDRNQVSPYFEDITQNIAGEERTKAQRVVLNRKREGEGRIIDIDWEKETVIKYIPYQYINEEFLANLPEAIGVAFVIEDRFESGLDVVHEGFLIGGENLFHASSIEEKVVKVDFLDYFFEEPGSAPKFDGIILFEVSK